MSVIGSLEDALAAAGQDLGVSEWRQIPQKMIDQFADVTDDHQWIHVEVERAAAESPYGSTIAHGFLTLSLVPVMSKEIYVVLNARMGLNYGLNKVRFLAPVRANASIRLRSRVGDVIQIDPNTVNLIVEHTVEIEGSDKPALVAELITRWVF